jgi:hypothetical protein
MSLRAAVSGDVDLRGGRRRCMPTYCGVRLGMLKRRSSVDLGASGELWESRGVGSFRNGT